MLVRKTLDLGYSGVRGQRIGLGIIEIINPFNGLETSLLSQGEFVAPALTGEGLNPPFNRGNQTALHDAN